jgi:hypothetical protein
LVAGLLSFGLWGKSCRLLQPGERVGVARSDLEQALDPVAQSLPFALGEELSTRRADADIDAGAKLLTLRRVVVSDRFQRGRQVADGSGRLGC